MQHARSRFMNSPRTSQRKSSVRIHIHFFRTLRIDVSEIFRRLQIVRLLAIRRVWRRVAYEKMVQGSSW